MMVNHTTQARGITGFREKMKTEYGDYWKSYYERKYTLPSYAEFVEMQPSAKPAKVASQPAKVASQPANIVMYYSLLKLLLIRKSVYVHSNCNELTCPWQLHTYLSGLKIMKKH